MPSKMRERFASFQRKTTADLESLWSTAEFTFDANVLLNLYESPRLVVSQFGQYLAAMSDRFYLTDQVVLEFYRNREKVINQAVNTLHELDALIGALPAAFSEMAQKEIAKVLESERKNLQKFLADGDTVEKTISDAVGDRIDAPFEDVIALYAEIERRYAAQVPPGFADLKEKEDYKKYGDAVLWLQVIAHQKGSQKPLILVTSDDKYDWWVKDRENKTVGPRPELTHEMWEKAQVHFHLYSFKQFMTYAAKQWPQKDGKQSGEEAIRVVAKMEQERELASNSMAENRQFAEVAEWVKKQQQESWTTQAQLRALGGNPLQEQLRAAQSLQPYETVLDQVRRAQEATTPSYNAVLEQMRRIQDPTQSYRSVLEQVRRAQEATTPSYNAVLEQMRRIQDSTPSYRSVLEQMQHNLDKKPSYRAFIEELQRKRELPPSDIVVRNDREKTKNDRPATLPSQRGKRKTRARQPGKDILKPKK